MILGKSTKSPEKHQKAIEHFRKLKSIQPLDAEDVQVSSAGPTLN